MRGLDPRRRRRRCGRQRPRRSRLWPGSPSPRSPTCASRSSSSALRPRDRRARGGRQRRPALPGRRRRPADRRVVHRGAADDDLLGARDRLHRGRALRPGLASRAWPDSARCRSTSSALRWYLPRSGPYYRRERVANGERAEALLTGVHASRTLRAYGIADAHQERTDAASWRSAQISIDVFRLLTRFYRSRQPGRADRAAADPRHRLRAGARATRSRSAR